jgi:dihydropteroate synthase
VTRDEFTSWLRVANAGPNQRQSADHAAMPRQPLVMGVLNITPDSFSDGGKFTDASHAAAAAAEMVAAGADLLDIGGESTRPGSSPVDVAEQVRRVVPVICAIRDAFQTSPILISIDTTRAEVASAALDAGANLVNDISAGRNDADMLPLIARRRVPVILMHMQGTPATMQVNPSYSDVVAEVCAFLDERARIAESFGVDRADVLLDPGIGFGKTAAHNLQLLKHLDRLVMLGRPVVMGTSRKGFIGKVTGETDSADRIFGTAATVAWAIANGAAVVRVHDVEPIVRVVRMIRAIMAGDVPDSPANARLP